MKTKHLFFLMLLGMMALEVITGCQDKIEIDPAEKVAEILDEDKPDINPTGSVAVILKSDIKAENSDINAANDQGETGITFGLIMKQAGQELPYRGNVKEEDVYANNVPMIIENGMFASSPPLMYPEEGNVDIIAYYPYSPNNYGDNPYRSVILCKYVDVTEDQSNGLPTEMLYSNNVTNQAPTESAVTLNFTYVLSKLELTVTAGANATLSSADFMGMTATMHGMYSNAALSLIDGTFDTHGYAQASIKFHKTGSDATSATFEALVIPTPVTPDDEIYIEFIAGGKIYSYKPTCDFESSTAYALKFELEEASGIQTRSELEETPDMPAKSPAILMGSSIIPRTVITQNVTADRLPLKAIEPEMVFVQGGTFTMGDSSIMMSFYREHQVTVSSFYMSKFEITQAEWTALMGSDVHQLAQSIPVGINGRAYNTFPAGVGDNYPVYFVSWDDVQRYITRLNTLTGKNYRLPTEAEWEYAARGGTLGKGYRYSGSNDIDDVAWHYFNIPSQTVGDPHYGAQPVGTKAPNELGIHDMSGNVQEWCSDAWDSRYYSQLNKNPYDPSLTDNPTGPEVEPYNYYPRVIRGGCWEQGGWHVAYRLFQNKFQRDLTIGFRLVCGAE